jgi:hypothetical protein
MTLVWKWMPQEIYVSNQVTKELMDLLHSCFHILTCDNVEKQQKTLALVSASCHLCTLPNWFNLGHSQLIQLIILAEHRHSIKVFSSAFLKAPFLVFG